MTRMSTWSAFSESTVLCTTTSEGGEVLIAQSEVSQRERGGHGRHKTTSVERSGELGSATATATEGWTTVEQRVCVKDKETAA